MSLSATDMSPADIAAVTGHNGNGGFFGDGSGAWFLIILFLFAFMGWGNNGGFGGNGGAIPYMMNNSTNADVQRGFDQSAIMSGINGLNTAVNTGFSNAAVGQCNQTTTLLQGINGIQGQIANTGFDLQNTMMQNEMARQQCCCDNKLAIADLKYTVATENCADRAASATNTRDIIDSQTRGTQAILDKLCPLELDGVKGQLAQAQRDNLNLQNQLNMASMRESQTAQNAFISQGFANEVDALYNRLNSCPVPTTPIYGRTPIFTCNGNSGCGCGCGGVA
jgi:hypothetical protein